MKLFGTLCLGCALLLLSACDSSPGAQQARFYAFGTEVDISLYGVSSDVANGTLTALEDSFADVDNTWHAWRPSTLHDINQAIAEQRPIAVSDDVAALIELAQTLAADSQHLFNPAAGRLFELWGFHQDNWFTSRPPPTQNQLDAWLASAPDMTAISIDNGQLRSENAMVKIGFGGFAKGYAVDQAIAVLQQQGIHNAMVNIGGDLRAIGRHGERPWVIGIRHPRQDGLLATIAVQDDESVFTSGDYERFFEFEGQRYPHIIDPRTAQPAQQATSVTVLHQHASTADAAATALFVAGPDWPAIATAMGVQHVMLVRPDGEIEITEAMLERISLLDLDRRPIVRPLD